MSRAGRRPKWHNGLLGLTVVLAMAVPLPFSHIAKSQAATTKPAITGSGPTKAQRIKVLKAALNLMHKNFAKLSQFTPSAQDVFDYDVGALWKQGTDGTGTTVAVMEGWNDPNITSVMADFDKHLGLPKAQVKTIFPTGKHKLPATCPPGMVKLQSYGSCDAWAGELELDVASVHLMAPYAKILIVVAPPDSEITDDAASQVAPPEFMEALEAIGSQHLANVVSISDGTAEATFSHGFRQIYEQDAGELTTAKFGVPVLVGTGDCDAVQHLAVGPSSCNPNLVTKGRASAAWDDSPWVTAVGGTTPNLNASGQRAGDDPVWNLGPQGLPFGEGAGYSAAFGRPSYQNGVAKITKSRQRSVPDISLDGSSGTSESGPLLAGILALATQLNHGQNVGPINPLLYSVLGPAGLKDGIADVVSGNNDVIRNGKVVVKGFAAAKGFDVASGWGTVRANTFAPALAKATAAAHQDATVRAQAAAALLKLEHRVALSTVVVSGSGSTKLTAQGFLAGHPVVLSIDHHKVRTLTANSKGTVRFTIRPVTLGLGRGRHKLSLSSMLITSTGSFRVS
ncbi:MAG TPA: S53 family peptidase [Streptosporangiaceae bacterium]